MTNLAQNGVHSLVGALDVCSIFYIGFKQEAIPNIKHALLKEVRGNDLHKCLSFKVASSRNR